MGFADRPYYRQDPYRGSGPGGPMFGRMPAWSMTTWLIVINAVVFFVDMILGGSSRARFLAPHVWGELTIGQVVGQFQLWRLVTYQFLHANFMHILFNMVALYFFGPMVEQYLGSRRYLVFYLLSGVGGGLLFILLGLGAPGLIFNLSALRAMGLSISAVGLVGASACIFGVLVAAARIAPNRMVMLLFPPVPMQLKTLVYIFLGLAVFTVVVGGSNAGGEAGHLGGAIVGFALIRRPEWLNFADRLRWKLLERATRISRKSADEKQRRLQAEIDRILAKVHDRGLTSLTAREKRILQQATRTQRKS